MKSLLFSPVHFPPQISGISKFMEAVLREFSWCRLLTR